MKRFSIILIGLLTSGCLNLNFDPPHLIKGPRILAIRAEPPEVQFGQEVIFETLLVDADGSNLALAEGIELRFSVCMSAANIVGSAGFGNVSDLQDNCADGGDDLVRLETGGDLPPGSARLPASAWFALLADLTTLMSGGDLGGETLDPALVNTLMALIAEVGVPLRVQLEIWRDGEEILIGYKRFALVQRTDPTTNPPPPRFAIDGVWLSARTGDPHACVPEEGTTPTLAAATDVEIVPDENEEAWIETYPVIGLDGVLQRNEESAYYAWYTLAGVFSADITQRPERNVTWTTPEEPGTYPLWLVLRDGHLGESFCRTEVAIVAGE